jgi:hypothetical protein
MARGSQNGLVPEPPPSKTNGGDKPIIATYPYCNEQRELLFEVVRFDTTDVNKRFRQRRPDVNGAWIWNIKGIRRVLYRLPQLIAAVKAGQRVLICEGEKDANTAVRLGYSATTNPGGINKWHKEYDAFFHAADVVVVSDNDVQLKDKTTGAPLFHPDGRPQLPGQDHAASVAKRLNKIAAQVRIIIFAQKDLTAWVEAGGTREKLDALIEAAPSLEHKTSTTIKNEGDYMENDTELASNVGNVLLALRKEPEIMNAFGFDEMLRAEVLLRPLFANTANFTVRPITDADVCAVQAHLQWFGFRRLGKDTTHDAINTHAREHSFHPVRDYLDQLRWEQGAPAHLARRLSRQRAKRVHRRDRHHVFRRHGGAHLSTGLQTRLHGCSRRRSGHGEIKRVCDPGRQVLQRSVAGHHQQRGIPAPARQMADRGCRAARL